MDIEGPQFRAIARVVFGSSSESTALTGDDAKAIIGIAQLAVGADNRGDDDDELRLLDQVIGHICKLAGIKPADVPASSKSLPTDDDDRLERMRGLGAELTSTPSRELAYAVAYLLSIADLDLAQAESDLIDDLAVALEISDDRSDEIAEAVAEAITPPA